MENNLIKMFAENTDEMGDGRIIGIAYNDLDWRNNTICKNGFLSGIVTPLVYNTINKQSSLMASVFAKILLNRLKNTNLIKVSNVEQTINGITFTPNDDGSITLNGTCTGYTTIYKINTVSQGFVLEKGAYYTFYLGGAKKGISCMLHGLGQNPSFSGSEKDKETFLYTGETFTSGYLEILVSNGATFNDYKVYPMVVEGTSLNEYVPYLDFSNTFITTDLTKNNKNSYLEYIEYLIEYSFEKENFLFQKEIQRSNIKDYDITGDRFNLMSLQQKFVKEAGCTYDLITGADLSGAKIELTVPINENSENNIVNCKYVQDRCYEIFMNNLFSV